MVKQGSSNAAINAMVEKNILQVYQLQSSRVDKEESDKESISLLTKAQQYALQELKSGFLTHSIALLHGVTSSGKTELYLQLMQNYLAEKKTVLYLLPEIGVTTQIVQRVKKHFGERVGVYHSKYNQNEKVELWQNTLYQKYDIIIGSRSAVFLPLENLGLVIIDEEHESSYKQIDAKPYYNARDTALVLAKKFSAKVVLGSATPSLETYYYAQKGVYKYISLTERFGKYHCRA